MLTAMLWGWIAAMLVAFAFNSLIPMGLAYLVNIG